MPSRATSLAALLAVVLVTAGCLGGPAPGAPGTATDTPTPTASPTPTSSPTPGDTPTATHAPTESASEKPEASHQVVVENRWNRSVTVQVTVVREATNETVHEGTYDLAAGEEAVAYDTADADPDGVETFTVTATARNATESVRIETSKCYGNAHVEITDDGELYPYYAIC